MQAPVTRRPVGRMLLPVAALCAVMVLGVGLLGPAADHRDGPIFGNTPMNGRQDINDLFIFQAPGNPNNTVLVYTVSPFPGVTGGTPVTFATGQFYDLKIDNDGDAIEDITFRVHFGVPNPDGIQPVHLRGLPAAHFAPNPILAQGKTGQNIPVRGGGMFRAANHDDPFLFDSVGFARLVNPPAPNALPRGAAARNFLGPNVNTLTIVLEIPTSQITRPGNPNVGYWGELIRDDVQVDRMGRPAINTALIPPIPRGSNNPIQPDGPLNRRERRNAFNAGEPRNDRRDFRADVIAVLQNFYGRNAADSARLADFLLPDILTFNTATPFSTDPNDANGFPNGRRLRDDVFDIEVNLLTNGAITTDNVPDDNGDRITDGTMRPDGTFRPIAFPYVGPPNDPPQGLIFD